MSYIQLVKIITLNLTVVIQNLYMYKGLNILIARATKYFSDSLFTQNYFGTLINTYINILSIPT